MGQYFTPVLGTNRIETIDDIFAFFYTHDYDCGLKLMEHSWIENKMMNAITHIMEHSGPYNVVWAGDYASETYELNDTETTLYTLCDEKMSAKVSSEAPGDYILPRYLVNYDKNVFVDLEKCPKDKYGWQVHPLPVLTTNSNRGGCEDYRDEHNHFIGSWCNDKIGFVREEPNDMEEIQPDFTD